MCRLHHHSLCPGVFVRWVVFPPLLSVPHRCSIMRPSCTAVASMVLVNVTGVQGFFGAGLLPGKAGLRSAADPSTARCSAQEAPSMTMSAGESRRYCVLLLVQVQQAWLLCSNRIPHEEGRFLRGHQSLLLKCAGCPRNASDIWGGDSCYENVAHL